jgi:5-methylcytosine-specific restriction endonuclease McrA
MRRPKRACIVRGCKNYTFASRCPEHAVVFEAERYARGATGRRRDTPEWRRLRKRIKSRDRWRCARCGARERIGIWLDVHHIDGNPNNNALSNLVTLCKTCHRVAQAELAQKSHIHPFRAS